MIDTKTNNDKLFLLWKKQNEVARMVADDRISIDTALAGTQSIIDNFYLSRNDRFIRYAHLLCPLSSQILKLKKLNKETLKPVPDSWFDNVDTTSDHVQSVEDLEFLFIVPGTLEDTFKYQVELIRLTQPSVNLNCRIGSNSMRLGPGADTELYKTPGIKKCRINLIDNWSPEKAQSINQIQLSALVNDKKLAGLPAIGAYASQDPRLYQSQNGDNLPYFNIADIQQGDNFARTPYSFWYSYGKVVCFHSCLPDDADGSYATPSFVL